MSENMAEQSVLKNLSMSEWSEVEGVVRLGQQRDRFKGSSACEGKEKGYDARSRRA